jgi:hypothetical protein
MSIQTRFNGDARGVVNVDRSRHDAPEAKIISTGVGKHISAVKITGGADLSVEMGVGGAVETILRLFQIKGTTIAYQVDGAQLSIIAEATGWGVTNPATGAYTVLPDADLTAALNALGNRPAGILVPVTAYDFTALVADTTGGIKFA